MTPEIVLVLGTLAGTLFGSAIGFAGTLITMRYQHRTKVLELRAQSRLRAKELMFGTYQERSNRINQRVNDLEKVLGSFLGVYKAIDDDETRRQLNEGMLALIQQAYESRREWFDELKDERRKVGLEDTSPIQMALIEKCLDVDILAAESQDEINQVIINIFKMMAASDNLWQDVLAKKGADLFREEIATELN